jgi:c-di-GMP-binding flagellar brake protein YcgR
MTAQVPKNPLEAPHSEVPKKCSHLPLSHYFLQVARQACRKTGASYGRINGMINKRRHKRVPLAASATIMYEFEGATERIEVMIADISLSGIGAYSDKRIKDGSRLSIEVIFISTGGLMKTVSMRGESVYAREIGGKYFIGIQFDEEINAVQQPSLHDHLQKILIGD